MRRKVLAAAVVLLAVGLTGCVDAAGSLSMVPVDDDASLAEEASQELPTDLAPDDDRAVVRDAIRNGNAEVNDTRPPVSGGLPYAHDGRYYNLSHRVVGSYEAPAVLVEIDYATGDVDGETVAYDDLSAFERDALAGLFEGPMENRTDGYDFGTQVLYTDDRPENATLLDADYAGIVYEGETYPVNVSEPRSRTVETYRYEATVVAEGPAAYAGKLRDRYEFALSGLSDGERSVVEEARNDTYYADSTDDEAFDALVDRFLDRPAVQSDDYSGSWIARYDGDRYWVELDFGQFVDDEVTPPDATPPAPGSG